MTKTVCPECNAQAYDDTSFFCYNCGARLSAHVQERKTGRDRNSRMWVLRKESRNARDDTPPSRKAGSIGQIRPIEICARCGAPIVDENKIYCTKCSAYVHDTSSGEEVPVMQYTVPGFADTHPVSVPAISHDRDRVQKEQEPAPVQASGKPGYTKASGWKILIIIGAIAILFFMLLMIVMLMFTFWASVY